MALMKRLVELQKSSPKTGLHLELLQAFEEHGGGASMVETVGFLTHLRKARESVAVSQRHRWRQECNGHAGLAHLRERLFADGGLDTLPPDKLSQMYNNLRRIGLDRLAEEVWPAVSARIAAGEMPDARALIGVWSVAPESQLGEVDKALAGALGDRVTSRTPQLLSTLSRAHDYPVAEAVQRSADTLRSRLSDLSSHDLATLGAHLSRAQGAVKSAGEEQGPKLGKLAELTRLAKSELVKRSGALDTQQLCGLLEGIQAREDPLWPMIRSQVLSRKDLTAHQALEFLRFLQRIGADDTEPAVFNSTAQQLRECFKGAQPGLIAMVSNSMEAVATDHGVLHGLLSAAVRLRRDLFPTVIWGLFVRAGEVGVIGRFPDLSARMKKIGEILEAHGVQRNKMTLREMVAAADAMKANQVVLPKSASQMALQFLEVHKEVLNQDTVRASEAEAGTRRNWLGEVQALMVSFWVRLLSLDIEDPRLSSAVRAFCASTGDCRIEALSLAQVLTELAGVGELGPAKASVSVSVAEGLTTHLVAKLPELGQRELLRVALDSAVSEGLWHAVAAEVCRRLPAPQGGGNKGPSVATVSALRRGKDFDDLLALLARCSVLPPPSTLVPIATGTSSSSGEDSSSSSGDVESGDPVLKAAVAPESRPESPSAELARRIVQLATTSFSGILLQEPEMQAQRLVTTVDVLCRTLGTRSLRDEEASRCERPLKLGLHRVVVVASGPALDLRSAAELCFAFAALSDGPLLLDTAALLFRTVAGASTHGAADVDGLSQSHAAKMRTFGLAVRHLSTRSALVALNLAPEALVVEVILERLEHRASRNVFQLGEDAAAFRAAARLRAALPLAAPGEACEELMVIPGTPYVADFVLPGLRSAIILPRAEHIAVASSRGDLNLSALLSGRLVKAVGWRLCWAPRGEWDAPDPSDRDEDGDAQALCRLLGLADPSPGETTPSLPPKLERQDVLASPLRGMGGTPKHQAAGGDGDGNSGAGQRPLAL